MATRRSKNHRKDAGHDERGRFARGNKFGRGNPRLKQLSAWRKALDEVPAERVGAVVEALVAKAMEGNVEAAREVLDRAIGRPNREPRVISFDLGPAPTTTAELVIVWGRLLAATASGQLCTDDAQTLAAMLGSALKVAEIAELEARIAHLERAAQGGTNG